MWHCAFETGERSSSWRFPVRPTKRRSICCATLRHSPRRSTHVSNERNSPEREVYPPPQAFWKLKESRAGESCYPGPGQPRFSWRRRECKVREVSEMASMEIGICTYPAFHVKHGCLFTRTPGIHFVSLLPRIVGAPLAMLSGALAACRETVEPVAYLGPVREVPELPKLQSLQFLASSIHGRSFHSCTPQQLGGFRKAEWIQENGELMTSRTCSRLLDWEQGSLFEVMVLNLSDCAETEKSGRGTLEQTNDPSYLSSTFRLGADAAAAGGWDESSASVVLVPIRNWSTVRHELDRASMARRPSDGWPLQTTEAFGQYGMD